MRLGPMKTKKAPKRSLKIKKITLSPAEKCLFNTENWTWRKDSDIFMITLDEEE